MSNDRRTKDRKLIWEYLGRHAGETVDQIGRSLKIHCRRVASILVRDLEPKGDAWQRDGRWHLTRGSLPEPDKEELRLRLKAELERAIFGPKPPEWLGEFAAGIKAGMSMEEAWQWTRRRLEIIDSLPKPITLEAEEVE